MMGQLDSAQASFLLDIDQQLVAGFSRWSNLSASPAQAGFVIGEGRSVKVQIFGLSE